MAVHHLEERAGGLVVRDRVRRGLEADELVPAVLVGAEAATAVVLGLMRRLGIVQTIGGVVPDIHSRVRERLAVLVVHHAMEVGVSQGVGLVAAHDRRSVRLFGHTGAVERAEDGGRARVRVLLLLSFADCARRVENVNKRLDAECVEHKKHLVALVVGRVARRDDQLARGENLVNAQVRLDDELVQLANDDREHLLGARVRLGADRGDAAR